MGEEGTEGSKQDKGVSEERGNEEKEKGEDGRRKKRRR